jgi:transcriptional regulator with XRE-family HTH domain
MFDKSARDIKAWLAANGFRQVDIAQDIGVSPAMIHRFVTGKSSSTRVLEHFLQLGCPEGYFAERSKTAPRKVA